MRRPSGASSKSTSPARSSRRARRCRKCRAGGRVINTASVWGRVAEPLFGAYVASKHAVIGLTKCWAKELGPRGITVNAVCPGWVETESSMRSLARLAERAGRDESGLLAEHRRRSGAARLHAARRHCRALSVSRLRRRREHHRPEHRHRSGRSALVAEPRRLPRAGHGSGERHRPGGGAGAA